MRDNGAIIELCPHCQNDTPVYRSTYNTAGDPVSFSVCVWCGGLIEYSNLSHAPHHPYASAEEIKTTNETARQHRRQPKTPSRSMTAATTPTRPREARWDPLIM